MKHVTLRKTDLRPPEKSLQNAFIIVLLYYIKRNNEVHRYLNRKLRFFECR